MFRKAIFWIHLIAGVLSGAIVAIMSVTGIAIAFEHEILGFIDRDARYVTPAEEPLSVEELKKILTERRPDFKANSIIVPSKPDQAYTVRAGRSGSLLIDPYTGEVRDFESGSAREFLQVLLEWHRWLGVDRDSRATGKLITGVSNLAFLILCLTGLYLWFPKVMKWRLFKSVLLLNPKAKGKARDFNWHNVFGIWSLPVLTVLVATAVVISFSWANKLVYNLAGEDVPARGGSSGQSSIAIEYPAPLSELTSISYAQAIETARVAYPSAKSVEVRFSQKPKGKNAAAQPEAISLNVQQPTLLPIRGRRQLVVDPYRATILKDTGFEDRSFGSRARTWIRFLHTGEAFGLVGKTIAALASAMSLILVYSGFALSYRRFFASKKQS